MVQLAKRFPVTFYVAAALLISYVVGIAAYLLLRQTQLLLGTHVDGLNDILLKFGPSLAGLLTSWLVVGTAGCKNLLRRVVAWRAPWSHYFFAVGVPPFITVVAFAMRAHTEELRTVSLSTASGVFLMQLATATLLAGGLSEELGWRGFMLPTLAQRSRPIVASFVVAAAWFAWHVPGYLLTDKAASDPILPFAVIMIPFSLVLTWLYYRAHESLVLPILLHGSINASYYSLAQLFPAVTEADGFQPGFDWVVTSLWCVLSLLVLATRSGRSLGALSRPSGNGPHSPGSAMGRLAP